MRSRTSALLLALTLVLLPAAPAVASTVEAPLSDAPTDTPTPEPTPAEPVEPVEPVIPAPTEPGPADPTPVTPSDPPATAPGGPRAISGTADDDPEDPDDDPVVEVADAELRWGLTNESNNISHAPGRFNFFSAGRIPDPGAGGHTVTQSAWQQSAGDVAIEKSNGTSYVPATWAGLRTDAANQPITSPSSRRFSDHQFVFGGGSGTVNRETGDATIAWDGDVTVVYYSGYTFFYLSDPELTVVDGIGTLRATLGGFSSSQTDLGLWAPLPETEVVLADIGTVDLANGSKGFTVSPSYLGRAVSGVDQYRQGAFWGAFPQSFVDFHATGGSAGFWYSSGSAFDEFKVPLKLTLSVDSGAPVIPPTPPRPPAVDDDPVTNEIIEPPQAANTPVTVANLIPPVSTLPIAQANPMLAQAGFTQVARPMTITQSRTVAANTSTALWWWLGATLLTLAAASVAGTFAYSAASSRR